MIGSLEGCGSNICVIKPDHDGQGACKCHRLAFAQYIQHLRFYWRERTVGFESMLEAREYQVWEYTFLFPSPSKNGEKTAFRAKAKKGEQFGAILKVPRKYKSKTFRKWRKEQDTLWEREFGKDILEPLPSVKSVEVFFYFPDLRVRDMSNHVESIQDFLVDKGVLSDDNWRITGPVPMIPMGLDRENPRVEVKIRYGEKKNGQ